MKKILLLLLFIVAGEDVSAQGVPTYWVDSTSPSIQVVAHGFEPFDCENNVLQNIYRYSDFAAGMPVQGFFTDIFIKLSYSTPAGSKLYGLTVKMGITAMNDYPFNGLDSISKALDTALTTVYYDSMFVLGSSLVTDDWLHLPLQQPFQYSLLPLPGDVPQNLMVQLSQDSFINRWPPTWLFNVYGLYYPGRYISLHAYKYGNGQVIADGLSEAIQIIGFNGYALSVDDPHKIKPFSVFPNPARDELNFKEEIKGRYKIYSLMGKKLLEGNLRQNEFIDVGNLPPGVYLLETQSGRLKFIKQ